jgi:regulator of sigma E protease
MLSIVLGLAAIVATVIVLLVAARLGHVATARLLRVPGLLRWGTRFDTRATDCVLWKRALARCGAAAMTYAVPVLLLVATAVANGRPEASLAVDVVPESRAEASGMRDGDRVLTIDGAPVKDWEQFRSVVQERPEQTVNVAVRRGADTLQLRVTPNARGRVGLMSRVEHVPIPLIEALGQGMLAPFQVTWSVLRSFATVTTSKAELTGPIGFVGGVQESQRSAWTSFVAAIGTTAALLWLPVMLLDLIAGLRAARRVTHAQR